MNNETLPIADSLFTDLVHFDAIRLSSWLGEVEYLETSTEFYDGAHSDIMTVSTIASVHRSRRYPIAVKSFLWHDSARRRSIPVRIYHPSIRSEENFPVIVFSHGLGGSVESCSYLGSAWASQGFVVVMVQHPGSDENVWKGKIRILHELQESYRANWSGRTRASDIRFVVDRLERLSIEGHWLASIMDLDRIGAGGYDLGCLAALLVAGQLPPDRGSSLHDLRIKAVLAMSPPVNGSSRGFREVYAPITIPAFFITGTEDDGIIGSTKAHQRRIPFDFIRENDRYLVTLRGADHRVYGGRILSVLAKDDKPFQSLISRISSCFWRATLQEDAQAQATLNGYGLNSMLGSMAYLERKLQPAEQMTENVRESETVQEQPMTDEKQTQLPPAPDFPVTRIYRTISVSENLRAGL